MKRSRLSYCATLVAVLCGTAASLIGTEAALSRTFPRDIAAELSNPEALVRQVASGMLEAAGSAPTRKEGNEMLTFAEQKILAYVDFNEAARLAAGALWTRASATQREQLAAAFRVVMVRGYLEAVHAHGGQRLAVLPPQSPGRSKDEVTVQSRIEGRQGAPLAVEYALHRRGGEWKIYDIRVDGESLVDACRPLFERIARAEGIAGLIKRMQGSGRTRPVVRA